MLSRNRVAFVGGVAAVMVGGACGSAVAGPDWVESGDAGGTFFSAQFPYRPVGALQLESISGVLSQGVGVPDYEDMYFIRVVDPVAFSVSMEFADFDAKLYLFNITVNNELYGLLGNDNATMESLLPRIVPGSTDGTSVMLTQPGDYVLAVTGAGRTPVSRSGSIFNLASPTEVSGADGAGGINPLSGWSGVGEQGRYVVTLTATDFPAVPGPGAGLVMAVGMLVGVRRRR